MTIPGLVLTIASVFFAPPEGHRFQSPFEVVRDGKPLANIVVASEQKTDTCLMKAAEELQKYIELLTGVKLPINSGWMEDRSAKRFTRHICLGKRLVPSYRLSGWFADDGWNEKLSAIGNTDGFAIAYNRLEKEGVENLHIFGVKSKGVMNGVFRLLENNTDIIWARPNEEIGTIYTPTNELSFVWGDGFVSRPDTPSRGWNSYYGLEWMARNGCNIFNAGGGGDIEWTNPKKTAYGVFYTRHLGGHNIQHFFRGVTNDCCFPRGPDNRRLSKSHWYGNPCFTSKTCLEIFVSNLFNCARMQTDGPGKLYINTQDTWNQCCCPGCTAPIRLPDGRVIEPSADNFRSTQFWMFMNEAGRRLAAEMPEKGIVSLAYFFTAPPPAVKLEPNVWPEFAPYVRANDKATIDAPENRIWFDRLKGWYENCSKNIEIYDYHGLGLSFPRPLAEIRAKDFQLMHPYVLGMSSENNSFRDEPGRKDEKIWDVSAMEQWVITRLYWDPRQDVGTLRDYFIARTFREAAGEIGEIYRTIRKEWYASKRASTLGDNAVELSKLMIVKPGHDRRFAELFAAAKARKTLHPKSRILVERLEAALMSFVEEARAMKTPTMQWPIVQVKGKLDWESPEWEKGATIDGFLKAFQKKGEVPSVHPSRVDIFHDGRTFFLRARLGDDKIASLAKPQVPMGKKEYIPESDHLEIFFTDTADASKYYMFSITPDDIVSDLLGYDGAWNCSWKHRARRTAKGWEAIVEIPLEAINAASGNRNDLKFLVLRDYSPHGGAKREYSSWGGGAMHQTFTFGDVRIIR